MPPPPVERTSEVTAPAPAIVAATAASASSFPGAGLDPDFQVPETEWETVSLLGGHCTLQNAPHPERVWPGFQFVPLEAGVESAELLPGPRSSRAFSGGTALGNGRDSALLATDANWDRNERDLLLTVNLRTATPLSILSKAQDDCSAEVPSLNAPRLREIIGQVAGQDRMQLGWLGDTGVQWLAPVPFRAMWPFTTAQRWGGVFGLAAIEISGEPISSVLHEVYSSPDWVRTPFGMDDNLFWTEGAAGHGRVMGLSADDQVHELVKTDSYYPQKVGVDEGGITWLGVEGPLVVDGLFERAVVYTCNWSSFASRCVPEALTELPIVGGAGVMEITERWIALPGCSDTVCDSYVIDRQTRAVYRILNPTSFERIDMLGIVDNFLYARGYYTSSIETSFFDRLVRFDLSQISEFSQKL